MKTSSTWSYKSIVGKMMMGLALTAMVGSIDVVPALGKDGPKNRGRHDNGRYEHRGRGYDRNHHYVQGRHVPYGYGYRERVYYPPPPVVYAPPPPPGIGIFFPPIFIRP